MSAPFCAYKGNMRNDGIFTGNKLESIVDFFKNRCSGYGNCLFSGDFLCKKDHEAETGIKSGIWMVFLLCRWCFRRQLQDSFCC